MCNYTVTRVRVWEQSAAGREPVASSGCSPTFIWRVLHQHDTHRLLQRLQRPGPPGALPGGGALGQRQILLPHFSGLALIFTTQVEDFPRALRLPARLPPRTAAVAACVGSRAVATAGAPGELLSPGGALSLPAPPGTALVGAVLLLAVHMVGEDGVMAPAADLVRLVVVMAVGGAGRELGVGRHCARTLHYLE